MQPYIIYGESIANRVWEYLCVQPYIIYRESIANRVWEYLCVQPYIIYRESIIVCGSICVCNLILFMGSL